MERIGKMAGAVVAKARQTRNEDSLPTLSNRPAGPPAIRERAADIDLPNILLSAWIPSSGQREIVRAMTPQETEIVKRRAVSIREALRPFEPDEIAIVNATLAAMLGGFRSMRQQGDDVEGTVEVLRHVLREFPVWAISDGCMKIAQNKAGLDPTWPPNDSQVYDMVAEVVRYWRTRLATAESMLSALVQEATPARPSRSDIEAKLGRPLNSGAYP